VLDNPRKAGEGLKVRKQGKAWSGAERGKKYVVEQQKLSTKLNASVSAGLPCDYEKSLCGDNCSAGRVTVLLEVADHVGKVSVDARFCSYNPCQGRTT